MGLTYGVFRFEFATFEILDSPGSVVDFVLWDVVPTSSGLKQPHL